MFSNSRRSRREHATTQEIHDHDHDHDHDGSSPVMRDIHAMTPHRSSSLSVASSSTDTTGENFTTISREFNALVLAGSRIRTENEPTPNNLGRIGEEEYSHSHEETNPLAIVLDRNPIQSPTRRENGGGGGVVAGGGGAVSVQSVKKEEAESKISAWQNAKVAKINNRFKREDAVINGWVDEQIQEATSCMKKVERKLEEKRAKALEKMENDIAKARRKAEEKRASAEAKRGMKVAKVLEISSLMRAVGRAPHKRSFF